MPTMISGPSVWGLPPTSQSWVALTCRAACPLAPALPLRTGVAQKLVAAHQQLHHRELAETGLHGALSGAGRAARRQGPESAVAAKGWRPLLWARLPVSRRRIAQAKSGHSSGHPRVSAIGRGAPAAAVGPPRPRCPRRPRCSPGAGSRSGLLPRGLRCPACSAPGLGPQAPDARQPLCLLRKTASLHGFCRDLDDSGM